jgi:carboxyl-terminal processing protease
MMVGALEALERRFDSVRFTAHENGEPWGTLAIGKAAVQVPLEEKPTAGSFQQVLLAALQFAEQNLGDEANRDEESNLELLALQGALGALDDYSTVFSSRGSEDFEIRFKGKLRGIGARLTTEKGYLTAVEVFENSPANRAGLRDGDYITKIDSEPTRPLTVREAVDLIRGEAGTPVELTVLRKNESSEEREEKVISITRGEVRVPSVKTKMLENRLGYAKIRNFSRTTFDDFEGKVRELGELDGFVLDLRGNTGGSMGAASALADLFLDDGYIFTVRDRRGPSRVPGSSSRARQGTLVSTPIVVLVDRSTASAAEILSGSMAPLEHVRIIGQVTFGKGLIQRVVPLPEDMLLKLTVGEYFLSGDRKVDQTGIEPNILLAPISPLDLGLAAAISSEVQPYLRKSETESDFPLDLAVALLKDGDAGVERLRSQAAAEIREALAEYGVQWAEHDSLPQDALPPVIEIQSGALRPGSKNSVRLSVTNPNPFPLPDVWISISGGARFLQNRITNIGTIEAGGTAEGQIEMEPDHGFLPGALRVRADIAAGSFSLTPDDPRDRRHGHYLDEETDDGTSAPKDDDRITLTMTPELPELEITVLRSAADSVQVTVRNLGCCEPGDVRVALRGSSKVLNKLNPVEPEDGTPREEPAKEETVELPVSGGADEVFVLLTGAGARRRVVVPLPEAVGASIQASAPKVEWQITKPWWPPTGDQPGTLQIQATAPAGEQLLEGWVVMDGEKQAYVAWSGTPSGSFTAPIDEEARFMTTKIEMESGISLIDFRPLIED